MTDELKPCCDYTTDIRCIFYESDEFGTRCRMHMGVQNPNYDDEVIRPKSCNMHFTREEMQRVIAAWNSRVEPDTLPAWAVEAIESMKNWAMRNPEYAAGFGDACDQILTLRKHEDDYD